jgi:uncharacterized protein (DUF1501 family)
MNHTRRSFLRSAAAGAAVLAAGPRVFAAARTAPAARPSPRKLVLIKCEGAYDSLNMLPPLTGGVATTYRNIRPVLAVRAAVAGQPVPLVQPIALPGVSAFGLHPSLGVVASEFGAGKCAIVQ